MINASALKASPSIGRWVHYVLESGKHRPAVMVEVWSIEVVNLQVVLDGGPASGNDGDDYTSNLVWKTQVRQDEHSKSVGTWHWMEYVPAQ